MIRKTAYAALAGLAAFLPAIAGAQSVGAPKDWQLNFQAAGSPVMEEIASFHDLLLYIIVAIALFVMALMGYVHRPLQRQGEPEPDAHRAQHRARGGVDGHTDPDPGLHRHPVLQGALQGRPPPGSGDDAEDHRASVVLELHLSRSGRFHLHSINKCRTAEECAGAAGADGQAPIRLLDVDNPVVVPVGTVVRLQLVSDDVIHSWAVPSLGVKTDAVPGRLQETWFEVTNEGRYYGQCSELCGVDHGYMPIMVQAVSKEAFDAWVSEAQTKFAHDDSLAPAHEVAQAQAR
jgi:cytochrome c oxidase subunit 2